MANTDLDKFHINRIDDVYKKIENDNVVNANDIFISDTIIDSLEDEKVLIDSFELPKILALLPFTPVIYVEVCPYCIDESNF